MVPQFTQGVFSQKHWRGVGDIDDCVVLADIACAHSVAPWLVLPGTKAYRAAAGNPDDPANPDGMTLDQSAKAIRTLWPKLNIEVIKGGDWASFIAKIKAGHSASVCVFSAAMATRNGKAVRHRGSLYWNGKIFRFVNPLRNPHTLGTEITEAAIKKAMVDYPEPGAVWAILFPTVEQAFLTHPLYPNTTIAFNAGVAAAANAALAQKK